MTVSTATCEHPGAAFGPLAGGPVLVPTSWVLEEVVPAYGSTWAGAFEILLTDPAELRVVLMLAEELTTGPGQFTDPIRLDHAYEADDEADDEVDGCVECRRARAGTQPVWRIGNGMHRLTAAVVTGTEYVVVCHQAGPVVASPGERDLELEFTLDLTACTAPPVCEEDRSGHPEMDFASSWLRSLRLADGTWVESFTSACGPVVSCVYTCTTDQAMAVLDAVRARCAEHQVTITFRTARLRPEGYWDDYDIKTDSWAGGEPAAEDLDLSAPGAPPVR